MKKITNCQKVFNLLRDEKPHYNHAMWDILGGGFALAARIWELRDPDGKYKLNIISGTPEKFNRTRWKTGDWYYQLTLSRADRQRLKDILV